MLMFYGALSATPPSVTVVFTAPGPIYGGVAIGNNGSIFFAVSGSQPQIVGLNAGHSQLWPPWLEPYAQPIFAIPLVSPDGSRLYFGSDAGVFYCLSTASGSAPGGWTHYTVPTGTDRRIRSSAAYDATAPNGAAVYFHCFTPNSEIEKRVAMREGLMA